MSGCFWGKRAEKALILLWMAVRMAPAQVSKFEHIVVIFQENRTPDNLFQGLCQAPYGTDGSCSVSPHSSQYNIQSADWFDREARDGVTRPEAVALANKYDLSHAHSAFLAQCNRDPVTGVCRMDGSASVPCTGKCLGRPQFRYVENSGHLLDPYLDLATQYGWANYMFQTNQGPSFPAHQFIFGGTSAPSAADDAAGIFASENVVTPGKGKINTDAGCIAEADATVDLVHPDGEITKIYPCFEHSTVPDILPKAITWRYYTPSAGSVWTAPNAIQHICESTGPGGKCTGYDWSAHVDLKPAHVLSDIAACKLESVSWVIPTGANSDHAGANDGGGPSWVAAIVNAIGNSSKCDNNSGYWRNTAIIVTWDDWGGWYDHEHPDFLERPEGDYQLGFRVPLVFISAYTPVRYINNEKHDFGSILRFVEHNFGIPEGALKFADNRANTDLKAFYDLERTPRAYQNIRAPKTAAFFLHDKRKPTDPDDDGDDH